MIQTGNRVRFSYIESPNGQLPPIVDDSTIYMLQDSQQLYVGNNLIAASEVSCDTTAGWAAKSTLVGKAGHVYIYSDHSRTTDGPWECDPDYYFDAPFDAYEYYWWAYGGKLPVSKTNNIPCIAIGTNFVFSNGEMSGGIIFISKEIDGTEFTVYEEEYGREYTFKYDGVELKDTDIPPMNFKISSGTYTYQGETWYYCTGGGGGSTPSNIEGVEYIPHLHEDWTEYIPDTVERIFELVAPESGQYIPGFKVGDGQAYLIDLPFVDDVYARHILDQSIHVSPEDRASWSSKITCYVDSSSPNTLVFSNS